MNNYLGIDIGGTKIAGAVITQYGDVFARDERPTEAYKGGKHVLKVALDLATDLINSNSHDVISGIGVAAGGQIDTERGVVLSATNLLPGWAGIQLKDEFSKRFQVTVSVENDVNALAIGEHHFGVARNNSTVVFLALGTGVGGAILFNGRVHHGANWTGGEIGHLLLSVDRQARKDLGGRRGTLEAFCSGPGLVHTWRDISRDYLSRVTGKDLQAQAQRSPHGPAADAIRQTGEYLGFGLVTVANMLDPDIIVIGGGLSELGDMLLDPARLILQQLALPGPSECPVRIATLGHNAAVIGAAALVIPQ